MHGRLIYRLVLLVLKQDDKSNEITAIPAFLELLDMAGCIITIDAMGTQTAIASQISNAKADYVLALKGNHPTLYGQVKNWFEQQLSQGFKGIIHSYDKRVEKRHHRTEKRQIWCVPISQLQTLHNQDNWVGIRVFSKNLIPAKGVESRYPIWATVDFAVI